MIIDTHCHLHFKDFDADREEVIRRAREAGVRYLINVGTDSETNEAAFLLAGAYDFMSHTAGLHPHSAHQVPETDWEKLRSFIVRTKPSAVGEIGLDYLKSAASPEVQKKVFSRMLGLAAENRLPVIVHSRNAFRDTLELLKEEAKGKVPVVMHCFSYDRDSARECLDAGFYLSFAGNVTFKNAASLLETAAGVPLDRLLFETDAPYLAPQAYRGKRNEPGYLSWTVGLLAEKRGIPREELERQTTENALRFFSLPPVR